MKLVLPLLCALPLSLLGCGSPSQEGAAADSETPSWAEKTPYRPVAGVKLLMTSIIDPASDLIWDSVGTIITEAGTEEIVPKDDEEWLAVRNAAVTIAESGNLLMMERRAQDTEDWFGWSLDLVDAGKAVMEAADARDTQGVFDAGGEIYMACRGCHEKYWSQGLFAPPE
jgi:hypothetical protein